MIHLTAPGLQADILPMGATLAALRVRHRDGWQDCVLTPPRGAEPGGNRAYLGVIAGRYANRIADGCFTLDGQTHRLDRNEGGTTTLHGGAGGFSTRIWAVTDTAADRVTLELFSPDGDQGFPGNLTARCTYDLTEGPALRVTLTATCDRACPVNLTNHAYFNLDGGPTVADHLLSVAADLFLPADDRLIPTGARMPVAGTAHDFRSPRAPTDRIDSTFVLPGSGLRPAARLESRRSGVVMEVATTTPGVHLYTGFGLDPLADGFAPFAGLCLETQAFPDSPNQPGFPDTVLRPGQTYRHETVFRFGPATASAVQQG
jgi:aldose 1-epimerase